MRSVRLATVVAAMLALGGCGTDQPVDPGDPGNPGTGEPPPGGSNPGTNPGGDPGTPGANGVCNSVADGGASLVMDVMSTALPALQGGAITDVRYVLTKYEWFDSRATLHARRIIMEVSGGGTMGKYLWQRDQEPEERATVTISTASEKIAMRGLCPSGSDLEWDRYGASGGTLVLFSTRDAKAATLTRQ
jgi:hypothetical protein